MGDIWASGDSMATRDRARRRKIVSIADGYRAVIADWLAPGAEAWWEVLEPVDPSLRGVVVDVLRAYEEAVERRSAPAGPDGAEAGPGA